eukprot:2897902-Amphidinium_carterae.1
MTCWRSTVSIRLKDFRTGRQWSIGRASPASLQAAMNVWHGRDIACSHASGARSEAHSHGWQRDLSRLAVACGARWTLQVIRVWRDVSGSVWQRWWSGKVHSASDT